MYLFTKTIFSQCPNEVYCIWMSILSIILFPLQIGLIIFLVKQYKCTKNEFYQFLMIVKISTTIFYQFQIIFGEVRTFFPRKTVICYGLVRFFGDEACQISVVRILFYIFKLF